MQKTGSYADYLKQAESLSPDLENLKDIEEDTMQGKTDKELFNYSMHEFFHAVQKDRTTVDCRQNMRNVLYAHTAYSPSLRYIQGMNMLVAYLLCFLDEEGAFWVLNYIIQQILPPDFYSNSAKGVCLYGFFAECYALKNVAVAQLDLTVPDDIKSAHSLTDMILPPILLPLFVDTLNSECLFYVWDTMIRHKRVRNVSNFVPNLDKKFDIVESTVITLITHCKPFILDKNINYILERKEIFTQEIGHSKILVEGAKFASICEKLDKYRDIFEKDLKKLWPTRSKEAFQAISSVSRYESEELRKLQSDLQTILKEKKGEVSKDEFSELLLRLKKSEDPGLFPNLKDTHNIFDLFDLDRDGKLDLK